jgi:CARDB protein/IPT/TIG domain-containing protein
VATPAPGSYQIIAVVDEPNAIVELDDTNNTAVSAAFAVSLYLPDLVMGAVTPTASTVGTGQIINVTNTVRNAGPAASVATTVRFFLSTDGVLDAGDVLLGTRAVPILAGGVNAVSTLTTPLTVPANTPAPGTYQIIAVVDQVDSVVELNPDNNVLASTPFAVTLFRADLRMDFVHAPPVMIKGVAGTVGNSVTNIGPAPAGPFTVRLYLFAGDPFDLANAVLVTTRSVPSLAAGATSNISTSITFPKEIDSGGTPLRFAAIADFDNAVVELSEYRSPSTNNIAIAGNPTAVGPNLVGAMNMLGTLSLSAGIAPLTCTTPTKDVSGSATFSGKLTITSQTPLANGIGFAGSFALTQTDKAPAATVTMAVSNGLLATDGTLSGHVSVTIAGPVSATGSGSFTGHITDGPVTFTFSGQTATGPLCVMGGTLSGMPPTSFELGYVLLSSAGTFPDDNPGAPIVTFPKSVQQYSTRFRVQHDTALPSAGQVTFTGPAGSGLTTPTAADPTNSHVNTNEGEYLSPLKAIGNPASPAAPVAGAWLVQYKGSNRSLTTTAPPSPLAVPVPTITLNDDGSLASIDWLFKNGATGATMPVPAYVMAQELEIDGSNGRVYTSEKLIPAATSQAFRAGALPWACVQRLSMTYGDSGRNRYVVSYSKTATGVCPNLTGGGGQPSFAFAFNFTQGTFDGVGTGMLDFPSPISYYFGQYFFAGPDFPPAVFFTGPAGSGLTDTESNGVFPNNDGSGAEYNSLQTVETPTAGTYVVKKANPADPTNRASDLVLGTFDVPDPQSPSRAVHIVPTVTLVGSTLTRIDWVYKDTAGLVITPPAFMVSVDVAVDGLVGGQVVRLFDAFRVAPATTSQDVTSPVTWTDVTQIQLSFTDDLNNRYTSFWANTPQPVPTITSFSPGSGPVDSTVTITGTNFGCQGCVGGVNSVKFTGPAGSGVLGVAASFTIVSPTQVTATVPAGAQNGPIWVQSVGGQGTSAGTFTVTVAGQPSLKLQFNRNPGTFGGGLTGLLDFPSPFSYYMAIFDSGIDPTPPPSVFFTGPSGSGLSSSESTARIMGGNSAGYVSAKTSLTPPGGSWTVTYKGNPVAFTLPDPASSSHDIIVVPTVTVVGNTLTQVQWQYFNAAGAPVSPAPAFMSSIELNVDGFVGGQIVRLYAAPPIAPATTSHSLTGAVTWTDVSDIMIFVRDDLGNVYQSFWDRAVPPAPTVTAISPTTGAQDASITITGTNFGCDGCVGGVLAVRFTGPGGSGAVGISAQFSINSPTQITATVPAGAMTGPIWIESIGGTAISPTFTTP